MKKLILGLTALSFSVIVMAQSGDTKPAPSTSSGSIADNSSTTLNRDVMGDTPAEIESPSLKKQRMEDRTIEETSTVTSPSHSTIDHDTTVPRSTTPATETKTKTKTKTTR